MNRTSHGGIAYTDKPPRICPGCGTEFTLTVTMYGSVIHNQRYCTQKCRQDHANRKRAEAPRIVLPMRFCERCKTQFRPTRHNHTFCSPACQQARPHTAKAKRGPDFQIKPKRASDQTPAVIPGTETRHAKGTFTWPAIDAAYKKLCAELGMPTTEEAGYRPLRQEGT